MAPRTTPKPSTQPPKGFDADLAAVTAAGDLPPSQAEPLLRRFLTHRSNLIVARTAKYAHRHDLRSLNDDLATAFHRFLPPRADPIKSDPQCWAKLELARTLAAFEFQSADLFLAGLHHHQLEPSWGGSTDTAGPLRGTCALALVQCRDLSSTEVLRHLTPLFSDKELPVRSNAARAVEQIGNDAAALLLRLRAELASDENELLAACIGGVLRLEGDTALPWAAAFLSAEDDLACEIAFLLAEHRSPAAVTTLQQAFNTAGSREMRLTLLTALATTRNVEAHEWLLTLIEEDGLYAKPAAKALVVDAQPSPEITARLSLLGYV